MNGPRRPHDPTGLTTGRWRVYRQVLIQQGRRAYRWTWRAEPIAVSPAAARFLADAARTFPTQRAALAYANERARRNLR